MKNKKLFAILTLVCFMLTLMPVAAFAAEDTYATVVDDYASIQAGETVAVKVTGTDAAKAADYYVFAEVNGAPYKAWDITTKSAVAGVITTAAIADPGEYTIYVVDQNDYATAAMGTKASAGLANTIAKLKAASNVKMLENVVTVNGKTSQYAVSFCDANMEPATKITVAANAGYTTVTAYAKLTQDGKAAVGKTMEISSNTPGVTVTQAKDTTAADGTIKFKVTATIAGNFKIYAVYGNEEAILDVTVAGLTPATVTTVGEPDAPIALNSDVNDSDVYFSFVDANGNNAVPATADVKDEQGNVVTSQNTKITVVEKPAGSAITDAKMQAAGLTATDNGYTFGKKVVTFDKEGTYTFKVTLSNGNFATATVEVKQFQKPVALKLVYPTNAVELDGKLAPKSVHFVDANGTTKDCKIGSDVVLSASGYAIADFDQKTGTVTAKPGETYVGSIIKVLAVSERYNLTDAVELVVAKEASAVKYVSTKADVAVNNTLVANIVDEDGNKVALNSSVTTAGAVTVQYVVLDKPENAKVAVSTKGTLDKLASQGQFKVSFTASEIGTYKLQTVVRYEQMNEKDQKVVKYYSGIEDITVGNTGFNDIVVMSIGSNEIVVNADKVAIDAAPLVQNNRTYVPFRALIEAFGAKVDFVEADQQVVAELKGTTVVMTIGSATYTVNGVEKAMDVAPFIAGDRTMIPVRFVAEAFGITVTPTYDENGATADVLFAK